MKLCLSAGHSKNNVGAVSLNGVEYLKNLELVTKVVKLAFQNNVSITTANSEKAVQADYLKEQVALANGSGADLNIQIHFNAFDTTATGCECYYYSTNSKGKMYAEKLSAGVSQTIGIKNRGAKVGDSLYWVKNTNKTAILLEVCFIDNANDMKKYNAVIDQVAEIILEITSGINIEKTVITQDNKQLLLDLVGDIEKVETVINEMRTRIEQAKG